MQPAKDGKVTIYKNWDRWLENETEAFSVSELRRRLRTWPDVFGQDDWRQPVVEEAVNLSFRRRKSGVGVFEWKAKIDQLLDRTCSSAQDRNEILAVTEKLVAQKSTRTKVCHYHAGIGFRIVFQRRSGQFVMVCPGLVGVCVSSGGHQSITSPLWHGSFPLDVAKKRPERFAEYLRDAGSPTPAGLIEWFVMKGVFDKEGGTR